MFSLPLIFMVKVPVSDLWINALDHCSTYYLIKMEIKNFIFDFGGVVIDWIQMISGEIVENGIAKPYKTDR